LWRLRSANFLQCDAGHTAARYDDAHTSHHVPGRTKRLGPRKGVGDGLTNVYQVFIPANYDPNVKWPVILFQHDGTSRGSDNQKQLLIGLGPVVKAQEATWKAITIFPQTDTNEPLRPGFMRVGPAALDSVRKHYNVDPDRIYLTGISSGAIFSYEYLYLHPNVFAAFVPISQISVGCASPHRARHSMTSR
jgi:predicted peptidase